MKSSKLFHALALLSLPALALLAGCGGGSGSPAPIGSRVAVIQDLGSLLGSTGEATGPAYATAINNKGQVVGYANSGASDHAFVWQNGKMTDLGTLSGAATNSKATAINDQGVIVGMAELSSPVSGTNGQSFPYDQACRFTIGGAPQALPVSTGDTPDLPLDNTAVGVNNAGQIVGTAALDDPSLQANTFLAYVLTGGATQAAIPTPAGFAGSDGLAINSHGQIAGSFETFVSAAGGATPTGSGSPTGKSAGAWRAGANARPPYSRVATTGRAISRARRTSRADAPPAPYPHAFVYSKGAFTDLGTLAGMSSYAIALNDAGYVVGYSDVTVGASHAFIWRSGKMTDLGTLGGPTSHADAIAPNNDVVGAADTTDAEGGASSAVGSGSLIYVSHAFIWRNGKMTDLNTLLPANSGWMLQEATGINSKGQIVGFGTHNGLGIHPFLLTL